MTRFNKCLEIEVGHTFDKDGRRITRSEAEAMLVEARNLLTGVFDGFSERAQSGGYRDDAGQWVMDEGACFVVFTDRTELACRAYAAQIRDIFRQSCVVCVISKVKAVLL